MSLWKRLPRIFLGGLTLIIIYYIIDWCATDAWKEMALHTGLKVFCITTAALIAAVTAMTLVIISQHATIHDLRLASSPEYVEHVSQTEDRYFEILDENKKLQMELTEAEAKAELAEQMSARYFTLLDESRTIKMQLAEALGQNNISGQYVDYYVQKHEQRDMATVGENNKFISADGMSKDERQVRAYYLNAFRKMSAAEIASELKISPSTAGVYISRGKALWEKKGLTREEYERGVLMDGSDGEVRVYGGAAPASINLPDDPEKYDDDDDDDGDEEDEDEDSSPARVPKISFIRRTKSG